MDIDTIVLTVRDIYTTTTTTNTDLLTEVYELDGIPASSQTPVPEPSTLVLLGTARAGLGARCRRKLATRTGR